LLLVVRVLVGKQDGQVFVRDPVEQAPLLFTQREVFLPVSDPWELGNWLVVAWVQDGGPYSPDALLDPVSCLPGAEVGTDPEARPDVAWRKAPFRPLSLFNLCQEAGQELAGCLGLSVTLLGKRGGVVRMCRMDGTVDVPKGLPMTDDQYSANGSGHGSLLIAFRYSRVGEIKPLAGAAPVDETSPEDEAEGPALSDLITELYEQYLAIFQGNQEMASAATALSVNRIMAAQENSDGTLAS